MEIATSDIIKVFGYACGVIGAMITVGGSIFALLRKSEIKARDYQHSELVKKMELHSVSTTKGLDEIKADLKPLTLQVAVHEEKIHELREEQKEINKWLGNLDPRVQKLERKVEKLP